MKTRYRTSSPGSDNSNRMTLSIIRSEKANLRIFKLAIPRTKTVIEKEAK